MLFIGQRAEGSLTFCLLMLNLPSMDCGGLMAYVNSPSFTMTNFYTRYLQLFSQLTLKSILFMNKFSFLLYRLYILLLINIEHNADPIIYHHLKMLYFYSSIYVIAMPLQCVHPTGMESTSQLAVVAVKCSELDHSGSGDDKKLQAKMMRDICSISLAFFFLFTSYQSTSNLQSSINAQVKNH